jgi:hypothetical protein
MLAVLAAANVLTGCASGSAGVETADPVPDPSVAASAAPASEPAARLGLTCSDAVPAALVDSLLNSTTVTTDLMVRPHSATPLGYAVSQLGGISCLSREDVDALSWVSVQVLPEATEQWATYAEKNAEVVSGGRSVYGDASNVLCFAAVAGSSCSVNILVGDLWIEVIARGIDVDPSLSSEAVAEHAAPLITDLVDTVAAVPAPGPLWVPPPSTGSLPADCPVYATAEEFRAAFGTAEETLISADSDRDGWGIDNAAWTIAGGDRCTWVPESTGQTWPLYITALPGGGWAFDRSSGFMTADADVETVADAVAGVDRATFGCKVYADFCTLDTVILGNWVQFSAKQASVGTEDEVRALLMGIAERAVARFNE